MLDAAQLRQGERVLDVGYGFALRRSKRRRGPRRPAGFGVDISAAMLQPARQRIAAAGVDNVELNFAPYAGQQGVVMAATAPVSAHREHCRRPVRHDRR
jgi:cyclopropane fatty-acyl-phospholipid synthase-like methyltransferase